MTHPRILASCSSRRAAQLESFDDRRAVRFFRKDGHNWQKKKDGKTVRETHEKLKVGKTEFLNCYYAHGEDDDRFQRRCYWLLDEAASGVVLVHYLRVSAHAGKSGGARGRRRRAHAPGSTAARTCTRRHRA